jgi:hypothetical protein
LIVLATLVVVASGALLWGGTRPHRIAEMHPASAPRTLANMWESADIVAVMSPVGTSKVHWNSANGLEWKSPLLGSAALIVRDDDFEVIEVLKGLPQPNILTIRGVGGTVDDVTMIYDGQVDWTKGRHYLLFLRRSETPTKEGFEAAWTEVEIGQTALEQTPNGRWSNHGLLEVTLDEVARLGTG